MTASPCPSGASGYTPVALTRTAPADYPASANLADSDLVVRVVVSVDPSGHVTGAKVLRSSGKADADADALASARASSYQPARRNCTPEGGTYTFTATFAAPVRKASEAPPAKIL